MSRHDANPAFTRTIKRNLPLEDHCLTNIARRSGMKQTGINGITHLLPENGRATQPPLRDTRRLIFLQNDA